MESLKKTKEFKKVYNRGKSYATAHLVLYFLLNNEAYNRFGFSISKKIGNAVVRNKLKRRLKEIIKSENIKKNINIGFDVIFIARKPIVSLDFNRLKFDVKKLLKRARIWN